ncbi:MAG: hypothetical protein FWE48_01500 [Coriobacteriia bacterium]|nr:hypothetical protein [Coriobacteriia bacterium]MCL2745756.1 hypothetical protein [Coriobacteriia bacterium]MCL2870531.1 hypothetical protein [Coriobacteriia bacterium]
MSNLSQNYNYRSWSPRRRRGCGCGCGTLFTVGGVVAMIVSWLANGSFWWMLFHGLLGWWYIAARLIFHWSDTWALFLH